MEHGVLVTPPHVSVIIPVYNAAPYIKTCVYSLLGQSLDNVELIFVDDASTDDSVNILREVIAQYGYKQKKIKVLCLPDNVGSASARNIGLCEATGRYVYFCDADDWVEPVLLERMFLKLEKTQADICWCDFFMEHEKETETCESLHPSEGENVLLSYLKYGWNVLWNMMVRRSIYENNRIRFYERINYGEDYGLTVRLVACSTKFAYVPQALYHYNRTNQNSLVSQSRNREKSLKMADGYVQINMRIIEFLGNRIRENGLEEVLSWRMLAAKREWIRHKERWNLYYNTYPISNKYIDLNPLCSRFDKFCQRVILIPFLRNILPCVFALKRLTEK